MSQSYYRNGSHYSEDPLYIPENVLPRINPLEFGLYIAIILLSTAALGRSILRLIQKKKWYGFYLYLLLASIVQLVQGIVLFLDRDGIIPQIQQQQHVRLSAEASFSCALFSSIFIWCSILLVFYRARYRATTKYYSGGELAKMNTASMLILYSFFTLILFILAIMLPASENTDLNSSSEVQPQILFFYTLCFQFIISVYVVIYAPLFIYYTLRYKNFIPCYFESFVFIIVVQIIYMISYVVLLYLTHIRADTLSRILLRVLGRDYLGLLSILYMLAIDGEAQWVQCDLLYVRTASNTLPYEKPTYQECFECGSRRYDECEHCDSRRYNVDIINLPT